MPQYTLPPWLANDRDIAGKFAQGAHLGAQIAQANASLQQQANEAQLRMDQAAKQNEQNFYLQQQDLAIKQQQHQQETQLRSQQLAQAQQKINIETQQAARQVAAQKLIDDAAAQGKDIGEVMLQHYSDLYSSPAGIGQLYKSVHPQPQIPASIASQNIGGKPFAVVTQPGGKVSLKQINEKADKGSVEQKVIDGKPFLQITQPDGRIEMKPVSQEMDTIADRQLKRDYRMQLSKDLKELQKEQEEDTLGKMAAGKTPTNDESDLMRSARERYLDRAKEIKSAMKEIHETYKDVATGKPKATVPDATPAAPGSKGKLTKEGAQQFIRDADGDIEKAREAARQAGYTF